MRDHGIVSTMTLISRARELHRGGILALMLVQIAACLGRSTVGRSDPVQSDPAPSDPGTDACVPAASIFVGVDSSTTQPYLRKLSFDDSAPLATQVQPLGIMTLSDMAAISGGTTVRALAAHPTHVILVGDADPNNALHPFTEVAGFDLAD